MQTVIAIIRIIFIYLLVVLLGFVDYCRSIILDVRDCIIWLFTFLFVEVPAKISERMALHQARRDGDSARTSSDPTPADTTPAPTGTGPIHTNSSHTGTGPIHTNSSHTRTDSHQPPVELDDIGAQNQPSNSQASTDDAGPKPNSLPALDDGSSVLPV
ncbi:hypothetical protein P153DRAFT_167412 [Dothidotthia symphoricarpi CBS 119687]|uniref:Uncharacterized protein n=1 Tax=Dothidotthia symphoricarpi CBS 119687 TaxID=1392245 RepID=A0A6A6AN37_9PLEO|nr:uncharacterized protein P153DRAFT_167412 [Dothidotthia symphoricarpi CBS 119687]KAF2132558.1 hypothetical protein P153DRAFT_167412 [Dothidotthia symphoricarpi CBS 119687]